MPVLFPSISDSPHIRLYSAGYLDELDSGLTQTGDTVFLKLSYAWQP